MPRIAVEMAELGSLVGDVSRAKILAALMDGRASTALELIPSPIDQNPCAH